MFICNLVDKYKLGSIFCYIKVYFYCFKDYFMQENLFWERLVGIFEFLEFDSVMCYSYCLNYVLQVILEFIKKCQFLEIESFVMDKNVMQFYDNVGVCECIFKIFILVVYICLILRVFLLWYIIVLFVFWNMCWWLMIFVIFLSVVVFFYIEEVGVLIEELFFMLDLIFMSDGIVFFVDGFYLVYQELFLLMGSLLMLVCKKFDYVVIIFEGFRFFVFDCFCECDVGEFIVLIRVYLMSLF